jgi:hypothetical protein
VCISGTNYFTLVFFWGDLVLKQTDFKFFVKITRTQGFRIPKHECEDWIEGSIFSKTKRG